MTIVDRIEVNLATGERVEILATPEREAEILAAQAARTTPVPESVTRRQAKAALILAEKIALVQPAIDAIQDPIQRALMQNEWDESLNFERNRPSLIALATAIGISSEQLDALFIQAGALP